MEAATTTKPRCSSKVPFALSIPDYFGVELYSYIQWLGNDLSMAFELLISPIRSLLRGPPLPFPTREDATPCPGTSLQAWSSSPWVAAPAQSSNNRQSGSSGSGRLRPVPARRHRYAAAVGWSLPAPAIVAQQQQGTSRRSVRLEGSPPRLRCNSSTLRQRDAGASPRSAPPPARPAPPTPRCLATTAAFAARASGWSAPDAWKMHRRVPARAEGRQAVCWRALIASADSGRGMPRCSLQPLPSDPRRLNNKNPIDLEHP